MTLINNPMYSVRLKALNSLLVGMTMEEAQEELTSLQPLRVIRNLNENPPDLIVALDHVNLRVNVEVSEGKITQVVKLG
jgi:hypothetical protein